MAIKELFLASALLLLPETWKQKTVSDELSSYGNIVHKVMESKENPKKLDAKLIALAILISEKNPYKINVSKLPHIASNYYWNIS